MGCHERTLAGSRKQQVSCASSPTSDESQTDLLRFLRQPYSRIASFEIRAYFRAHINFIFLAFPLPLVAPRESRVETQHLKTRPF